MKACMISQILLASVFLISQVKPFQPNDYSNQTSPFKASVFLDDTESVKDEFKSPNKTSHDLTTSKNFTTASESDVKYGPTHVNNNSTHMHWLDELFSTVLGEFSLTQEIRSKLSCSLDENEKKCCSCKPECVWFHDCCLDHLFHNHPKSSSEYLEMFFETFNVTSKIESVCTPILKKLPNTYSSLNIMMVTHCFYRGISSKKIEEKCENENEEDYKYFVPVAVVGILIFRNRYCALCNGFETYLPYDIIYQGCIDGVTMPGKYQNHTEEEKILRLHNFLSRSVNCRVSIRGKTELHNEMIRACSFE